MNRVLIEVPYRRELYRHCLDLLARDATPALGDGSAPVLDGVEWDEGFAPLELPAAKAPDVEPGPFSYGIHAAADPSKEAATYLLRGTVEDAEAFADRTAGQSDVVGVFSDVAIQPCLVCPGSPPVGTDATVEKLLCVRELHARGMDGSGVLVAIVDSGINVAYLNSKGKSPGFDAARSWVPQAGLQPGNLPVGHGTMCAYDVCIAAPKCTLLDVALLQSQRQGGSIMDGFLSDAVLAYRHLIQVMEAPQRPGESRSLVVNNSWGMFHPSWDFPVGHPGNYSDNPNHPFNRIVGLLEAAGADILFAAGNCGKDCPDGRCKGVTTNAIYGANSHPRVLSIAGVDTTKQRVGYSTMGPGRLEEKKPDLAGYTHFKGSGVYPSDGGTSAATPVVSGVVAAIRAQWPRDPADPATSPAAVRSLLVKTAEDRGPTGYDFGYGWGIVNPCDLPDRLRPQPEPEGEKEKKCRCRCVCRCECRCDGDSDGGHEPAGPEGSPTDAEVDA